MEQYQPTKEELAIINEKFAKVPYKSEKDLYSFPAMIIDNRMTAYFTRMHPTFLDQCVKDLINGVVFMVGHDTNKLPMGRSFKGQLVSNGEDIEVFAKFFMQKNLETNGVNTDDFMKAFFGGTTEDVSIGFSAKRWECSICGKDIRNMDCPHWPGKRYNDKGEEVETGGTLCFAWVMEPAGPSGEALREVSAVYKGAVPKAKQKKPDEVPKFALDLKEGKSLKETPEEVAVNMNFSFPLEKEKVKFDIEKFFAGEYSEEELKEILTKEDINTILEELKVTKEKLAGIEKDLKTAADNNKILLEQNEDLKNKMTALQGSLDALEAEAGETKDRLEKEVKEVKDLNVNIQKELDAKKVDLDKYKTELINEVLELGIKLNGNSFEKEKEQKILEKQSIDEIKETRKRYLDEFCVKYPGSKFTAGPLGDLPKGNNAQNVPDEGFKI